MSSAEIVDDSLLVDTAEGVALLGSSCTGCSAYTFPTQATCPRCGASSMRDVPLSRTGTLWSFTVQGFSPKTPYTGSAEFEPYGVGYVELPGQLVVEARLTESDPARLRIGMPMRLELVPFRRAQDGTPVLTYAFTPEEGS